MLLGIQRLSRLRLRELSGHGCALRNHPKPRLFSTQIEGGEDAGGRGRKMLDSLELMLEERKKPTVVGRWDWHAWQFFTALLPSFAILGIASIADWDMKRKEIIIEAEKKAETEAQKGAILNDISDGQKADRDKLEARLQALEKELLALKEAKAATSQAPAPSGQQRQPPAPVPTSEDCGNSSNESEQHADPTGLQKR